MVSTLARPRWTHRSNSLIYLRYARMAIGRNILIQPRLALCVMLQLASIKTSRQGYPRTGRVLVLISRLVFRRLQDLESIALFRLHSAFLHRAVHMNGPRGHFPETLPPPPPQHSSRA